MALRFWSSTCFIALLFVFSGWKSEEISALNSQQEPDERTGLFSSIQGYAVSLIFKALQVTDVFGCVSACLKEPCCQSFNFDTSGNPKHLCELSQEVLGKEPRPGFIHYFAIKVGDARSNRPGQHCQLKTDIDECQLDSHNCSINQTCVNTAGSYDCICKPGYQAQGITCTDIDECVTGAHNCSADSTCVNTEGSFECRCSDGYKMFDNKCTKISGDYVITVYTADTPGAGTDANVFIKLHGSHFNTEIPSSEEQLSGNFEQGSVDTTSINSKLPNMESLSKITIRHDNAGSSPVWHLNKVIVDNKTRRMKYTFACNCKLGKSFLDGNHPLSRDIRPTTDSVGRPIVTRY